MNNSSRQNQEQRAQNIHSRWRAKFWPQAVHIYLLTSSLCDTVFVLLWGQMLLYACTDPMHFPYPEYTFSPVRRKKFHFSAAVLQMPASSCLVPLSGCKITICLIAGDVHTPQQLGSAQIICYTRLFSPLYLSKSPNLSAFRSMFFFPFFFHPSAFSPRLSWLVLEVVIHQTATSVRCQAALMNDSDERVLNEGGKLESRVIIRKALFSAYCCLLFIFCSWGQSALIRELSKLRNCLFFNYGRIKTPNVALLSWAGFVRRGNVFYLILWILDFLFWQYNNTLTVLLPVSVRVHCRSTMTTWGICWKRSS